MLMEGGTKTKPLLESFERVAKVETTLEIEPISDSLMKQQPKIANCIDTCNCLCFRAVEVVQDLLF